MTQLKTFPQGPFKMESGTLAKFTGEYRGSIYYQNGSIHIHRLDITDIKHPSLIGLNISDKLEARSIYGDHEVPFTVKNFSVISVERDKALVNLTATWHFEKSDSFANLKDVELSWEMAIEIDDDLLDDFPSLKMNVERAELSFVEKYYMGEINLKSVMYDKSINEYDLEISEWYVNFKEILKNGYKKHDDETCMTIYIGSRHNTVIVDHIDVIDIHDSEIRARMDLSILFEEQMVRWRNFRTSIDVTFRID